MNNQFENYATQWSTLDAETKMKVYEAAGGTPRADISNLNDVLAKITPNGVSLPSSPLDAATQLAGAAGYTIPATSYNPGLPHGKWPVLATPPKSLYKYQTLHTLTEVIKVCIPWYLGTKFAIAGAGAIIPG